MTITSINPATLEPIASHREHSASEVAAAAEACHLACRTWRATSFNERAVVLRRVADSLESEAGQLAHLMACEMGKPIRAGQAEVTKCAWVCRHYAEHGERLLAREHIVTEGGHSLVTYQPLGVVLAIMPWNFPLWQVFRATAPTLMAGNGLLLKHAPNVMGCAKAIERLFSEAGTPSSLFRSLVIGVEATGAAIDHPDVQAVTFTGSVAAGRKVAARAAEQLKKTVLELGGSDPYIVLEDADLELAARVCAQSRLVNGGQSCIAAKRFVVVSAVKNDFVQRFLGQLSTYRVGDALDERTQIGPLARLDLRDQLHAQVEASVAGGARVLLGGIRPHGPGAFYPVTALDHVRSGTPAYREELFGPVAAIIEAKDEQDAIRVANDTRFGLGAAVFTRDTARAERIAEHELEAGCCSVNGLVQSDPRLPFGGIKESGYGRELGAIGIREFVNIKTVTRP